MHGNDVSKEKRTRILFVSRAYPPVIGGIENQNYELSQWLPHYADVTTIANTKGKKALLFFLPWMLLRLLFTMPHYDVLLVGDGVLGILCWWTKLFFPRKKTISIVHGLDLTFTSALYQKCWVQTFIPSCDRLIAVGNQTIREGVVRGIPREKFVFVPNGIDPEKFVHSESTRDDLYAIIGEAYRDKKVILTSGRLACRKGVAWFVRSVLPTLPEDVVYVVAGEGPDRERIVQTIAEKGLAERVVLLGYVSDETRNTLLHTCDLFVQPNITVPGDMEGFGISVIEAAASGIPVLAADLEGLKDAIIDNENGFRIASEDAETWRVKIGEMLTNTYDRKAFGEKAARYVVEHNSWDTIAKRYIEEIEKE